jgi:hypothetical protein
MPQPQEVYPPYTQTQEQLLALIYEQQLLQQQYFADLQNKQLMYYNQLQQQMQMSIPQQYFGHELHQLAQPPQINFAQPANYMFYFDNNKQNANPRFPQ